MQNTNKLTFVPKAVLLNDTSVNNHHGCKLVIENIHKYCKNAGIDIIHTIKINERWDDAENVQKIKQAHILLVNGEGTMHHSKNKAILLASSAIFCRDAGIMPVLFNSVYESNNEYINNAISFFKLIFVRESKSKRVISSLGFRSEIVPDMTFGTDINLTHKRKNHYILITDSVDKKLSNKLFDYHKSLTGAKFITMRVKPKKKDQIKTKSLNRYLKDILLRLFANKKTKATLNPEIDNLFINSTSDFISIIASARFVVTGRFHAICVALQTQTPFVALSSNTHKIEGLLNDVGLSHRLIDEKELKKVELTSFMAFSKNEIESISQYCNNSKKQILEMFTTIKSTSTHELFDK